jgi:hypothetical protein
MKQSLLLPLLTAALTLSLFTSPAAAADAKAKAKPYPLDTCLVSDEKIGADPSMKPYVFVEDGQEIKLCCKSCLKEFKKDKANLMKKIAAADKKKNK